MIAAVTFDPATFLMAIVALLTALRANHRGRTNRSEVRNLRKQLETLRRHLRIVVAALAHSEKERHELEEELDAARRPVVRSRTEPPHATQD